MLGKRETLLPQTS